MNGGYYMLDFSGINLFHAEGPDPTVPGTYSKVEKAYNSGKPVMLYNLKYNDGEIAPDTYAPTLCAVSKCHTVEETETVEYYSIEIGQYIIDVRENDTVIVDKPVDVLGGDVASLDVRVTALEKKANA